MTDICELRDLCPLPILLPFPRHLNKQRLTLNLWNRHPQPRPHAIEYGQVSQHDTAGVGRYVPSGTPTDKRAHRRTLDERNMPCYENLKLWR